jgi:lysophospholipase L1-like esterase
MKKCITSLLIATAVVLQGQTVNSVWELGRDPLDASLTKGKIELVAGVINVDSTNSFALPAAVLGTQSDYTVEFEVKRPAEMKQGCGISLVSNTDEKNKAGFGLNYFPPDYNACALFCNGYQTVEQRGFLGDAFIKLTFVVKDGRMTMFRNGLLLAIADAVKPSVLPLVFGGAASAQRLPQSYALRNIKIYNQPIFPTGFDQSAERMRNYSGDQYFMQRAEIKDPSRPRILVIGDSISMGYRSFIAEHFKGKAYVDYWVGGGTDAMEGENATGKRAWKGVLSNGPYTVVTWNSMSLHSWPKPDRCPEEKYAERMTRSVAFITATAPTTKFIWIRTTPWRTTPDTGTPTLNTVENERIIRFNKTTDEIMAKYGIPEVDLYALCETKLDTVAKGSKDSVHWNQEVCKLMATEIIKKIEKEIK